MKKNEILDSILNVQEGQIQDYKESLQAAADEFKNQLSKKLKEKETLLEYQLSDDPLFKDCF